MSTIPPLVPVEQGNYEKPSPAPIEGEAPPRIPHLGHAGLFLIILFVAFFLAQRALFLVTGAYRDQTFQAAMQDPTYILLTQAGVYIATLLAAGIIFPLLWQRTFTEGIQWNFPRARMLAGKIVPAGLALSLVGQALSHFITVPKSMPMDQFFHTRTDIWLACAMGTLLAPLIEETFFRGFLFPAFAIAYDWISLPRTPEAILLWRSTNTLSKASYFFSGFVTSVFFAMLHAAQLGYTWPLVALLFGVSCVFTWVRVRTHSVACSALLHASYNLTLFLITFIGTKGFTHLENLSR